MTTLADLGHTINTLRDVLNTISKDDSKRIPYLNNLGNALWMRSEVTGSLEDLASAIIALKAVIEESEESDPNRPVFFNNLSNVMLKRFENTGSLTDLNDGINAIKNANTLVPRNHPKRIIYLNNLCKALIRVFERTPSSEILDDLANALVDFQNIVNLLPENDQNRPVYLNTLSNCMLILFETKGSLDDLNAAVRAIELACESIPDVEPDKALPLNSLGNAFLTRYHRTGSLDDLNSAVKAHKQSVDLTPDAHPALVARLANYGVSLQTSFSRTGSTNDLAAAIDVNIKSLQSIKSDHPLYATCLGSLATAFEKQFERTGSLEDLNSSVIAHRDSVIHTSQDHPNRPKYLNNFGVILQKRFNRRKSQKDLDLAYKMTDEAIRLTTEGPIQNICLNNLGIILHMRSEMPEFKEDLVKAIEIFEKIIPSTPKDDPALAGRFHNLGKALQQRFLITKDSQYAESAAVAYGKAVDQEFSPPIERIRAAIERANLLYSQDLAYSPNSHEQFLHASTLLTKAIELLPKTSPRTLQRNDQQFILSGLSGFANDAAALSILTGKDVSEALRLLELGRGVMANIYLEARSDLTELAKAHPELAEKFKRLRDELDVPNLGVDTRFDDHDSVRNQKSTIARKYEASKEFDETIETIRKKNGFERFLRGPSSDELKGLVPGSIVFLNSSRFGSDAFIITDGDIRHIPLSGLLYEDVKQNSEILLEALKDGKSLSKRHRANVRLEKILAWLWDAAIAPILDNMGFVETPQDDAWPHIWWIPSGRLSLFPIHASGYHSNPCQGALDRVISSFTHTVRALDHARTQLIRIGRYPNPRSQIALLASMPSTPIQSPLPYAAEEVKIVDILLPQSISRVILQSPTKSEVLKALGQCSVAHFACHGVVDEDPSKSGILFSDWETDPFSVADVSRITLDNAELAYISACHAATSRNFGLLDESIHLAGAFQLAGFPTVVGTLWQIDDDHSATVAQYLYRTMLTQDNGLSIRQAAIGLHFALRNLREARLNEKKAKTSDPLTWAPYVHVGL